MIIVLLQSDDQAEEDGWIWQRVFLQGSLPLFISVIIAPNSGDDHMCQIREYKIQAGTTPCMLIIHMGPEYTAERQRQLAERRTNTLHSRDYSQ